MIILIILYIRYVSNECRLPLPNVNDDLYTRNKRIIQSQKVYPQLLCPRSIAIDRDGNLYTGTLDGNVYCIWQDGSNRQQIVSHFDNGRPLGMRMSTKNVLYFVEANSGLYSYDIDIKLLHHLLGILYLNDNLPLETLIN